jgi:anti-sigma factor RsiW
MVKHITDADLQAYVDHRLSDAERSAVDIHLAAHPDDAQKLARYSRLNDDLRELFDPVLNEKIPDRLLEVFPGSAESRASSFRDVLSGRWAGLRGMLGRLPSLLVPAPASSSGGWRPAAYALTLTWLSLGVVIGWQMQRVLPQTGMPPMVRHAAVAYATYASETAHPVEIQASEEDHLEAWLSRRLGMNLKAPRLEAVGFTLMGGRLLAGTQGPAAQFMYEDKIGRRLTLYVKTQEMGHDQSAAFRFAREKDVNAFYWIDSGTGYVLSGNLDRSDLFKAAEATYRQLGAPDKWIGNSRKSASMPRHGTFI